MVRNANERPVVPVSSPAMNQVSDSWSTCSPSAAGKSSALSLCTSRNGYLRQSLLMSFLGDIDRVVLVGSKELAHLVDVVVGAQLKRFGGQAVVDNRDGRLSDVLRKRPFGGLQGAGRLGRQPRGQSELLVHEGVGGGDAIGQAQIDRQLGRDPLTGVDVLLGADQAGHVRPEQRAAV